jgi:hypothetical protein
MEALNGCTFFVCLSAMNYRHIYLQRQKFTNCVLFALLKHNIVSVGSKLKLGKEFQLVFTSLDFEFLALVTVKNNICDLSFTHW